MPGPTRFKRRKSLVVPARSLLALLVSGPACTCREAAAVQPDRRVHHHFDATQRDAERHRRQREPLDLQAAHHVLGALALAADEVLDSGYASAWYLDEDYDGDCFVDCQMFFDFKKAPNLKAALKADVDPEEYKLQLTSQPFPVRGHKRIAVKVVDVYGNESTVVKDL